MESSRHGNIGLNVLSQRKCHYGEVLILFLFFLRKHARYSWKKKYNYILKF